MNFFENLNFSSANEDGATEIAALRDARRIVCLTGSGTRPLDLLLTNADEVIALDMNPAQNALLQLKMAAIAALDHGDYLAFLGIAPRQSGRDYYSEIRMQLPPDARIHWDQNRKMLHRGVWYAGKWEKLLAWNAFGLKLFRAQALRELFAAKTIEQQADIWQRKFNDSKLRRTVEMIGRRWVWKWIMREPAGNFLPDAGAVSERLAASFSRASHRFLFRDSDFINLALLGKMHADGALPVHMRKENYEITRARLSKLRIVLGGLMDLPHREVSDVNGFSLSDFGSYCGPEIYAACWRGVLTVAAPDAKFCERIFMNDMPPPFPAIKVDDASSAALTASDMAIIYDIRTGTIGPHR